MAARTGSVQRSQLVEVSTGEQVEVGTFVLGEESEISASDLLTPRQGERPLGQRMQLVLDFVGAQEGPVTPMDVSRVGLTRDNKEASQMLSRLHKRQLILNPALGEYRRLPDFTPASEETPSSRGRAEAKN